MKKKFIAALAVVVAFGLAGCQSETTQSDSLTTETSSMPATAAGAFLYEDYGDGEICITGLSNDGKTLSEIIVPEEIGGCTVTGIGDDAFRDCTNLRSFIIPDSVTAIGGYAFINCSNLESVNIPEKITAINGYTFYGCSSLTNIQLPEGITRIGISAFNGCSVLEELQLPETITEVGMSAFKGCDKLKSITIKNGMNFWYETIGFNYDSSGMPVSSFEEKGSVFSSIPQSVLFRVPEGSEMDKWAREMGYSVEYID